MIRGISALFFLIFLVSPVWAQQKQEQPKQGPPPAQVVVSEVVKGMVVPEDKFIGTVYYPEISDLASEVDGKVDDVNFEEGRRVKKGDVLVRLDSQLLAKNLQATKASHEQVLAELENAQIDSERMKTLFKKDSIAAQVYDEYRFKAKSLTKRASALEAEVERFQIEIEKKMIRAPFNGIVIEKFVDRGEWLSPGSVIASIGRDDQVDIRVNVPNEVIQSVSIGMKAQVEVAGKRTEGKVFALIPKGDIATRTFPVKIRTNNSLSLVQGMEATVSLPRGKKEEALMVPRDGVIDKYGKTVLFTVVDSAAKMIPVRVIGYQGMMIGVEEEPLREGMQVVTKGNERLTEGQPVQVQTDPAGNAGKSPSVAP